MSAVEWRPVPTHPNYQVSSDGQVRSARFPDRLMAPAFRPDGRPQVVLYDLGKPTYYRIHVLVALAFLGPKPDWAECVRHLNDDRLDNRVENLAYGTHGDNSHDTVRNGHHVQANRTECIRGHSLENAYHQVRSDGSTRRACRECKRQWMERHRRGADA